MMNDDKQNGAQKIEAFLRNNPEGNLLIAVGYASPVGLAWLHEQTIGRSVKILIGDAKPRRFKQCSRQQAREALHFISRPDVEVLNWYRTDRSSKGRSQAHLKTWVIEIDGQPIAALNGSANLTQNGLFHNVESMHKIPSEDLYSAWYDVAYLLREGRDAQDRIEGYLQERIQRESSKRNQYPRRKRTGCLHMISIVIGSLSLLVGAILFLLYGLPAIFDAINASSRTETHDNPDEIMEADPSEDHNTNNSTANTSSIAEDQGQNATFADPIVSESYSSIANDREAKQALVSVAGAAMAIYESTGTYMPATPEYLASLGFEYTDSGSTAHPLTISGGESDSLYFVSVKAPVEQSAVGPIEVWAASAWSPLGCIHVVLDPHHGQWWGQQNPDSYMTCAGSWAQSQYFIAPGQPGQRNIRDVNWQSGLPR